MKQFFFIFSMLFSVFGYSQSINSINDVPNQREIDNVWISNPHNILTYNDVNLLDTKVKEIEKETSYEIAIVVLNSINDHIPYDFGLDLFNKWGIGKKEKDNGLLILVVLDSRNLSFISGSGTEIILSDAMTFEIGETKIKPDFRNGNYGSGLLNGLEDIFTIFKGNSVPYISNTSNLQTRNQPPFYKSSFFIGYITIAGVLFGIYLMILIVALFVKNRHKKYHILKGCNLLVFPIVFPIPFAFIYFANKYLMERWRNTIRFSEKTGEIMHKLNEDEEDKYLTDGQITEETVKAIDYDVWVTESHDEILILKYVKWFSKFDKCPSCSYKSYFKEYDKTITNATYISSGTGEKKYYCENCNHVKIKTYIIPRLTRSARSGGGGFSGGGGGGSSWGGGGSSGGGSSSGW